MSDARGNTLVLAVGIGVNPEAIPDLIKALEAIAAWPGNLPDSSYTSRTGPNDAALRGEMLVCMRTMAKVVLGKAKL